MSKLEIQLNEIYKSFENGFSATLEGKLVILSGVNGAGKSQLITTILGFDRNTNKKISSNIKLDGIEVKREEIDFRSFKENIGLGEITRSTSQTFLKSIDDAWQHYSNYRLDHTNIQLMQLWDSMIETKNLLLRTFTLEKFNTGIDYIEFKDALQNSNLIWRSGDKFSNIVGEIFFLHILKVSQKMIEVGRGSYTTDMLEEAPWVRLNKLFIKLKFDYKFKDTYELKGVEINEQPKLFAIKEDGSIDENNSRNLNDLSDGEKTIISLCFATLIDNNFNGKKLLLLDELDSVLNPSLIQIFFTVIEEFFIDRGIMVILSTHSPATISLSPDYSKFYEIFKLNHTGKRILEVSQNEYSELLIANKNFYDKISNQEDRIRELQNSIISSQNILIVTEGKTDWKYFISALRFFHKREKFKNINAEYFYRFGSKKDLEEKICDTKEENDLSDSKLKNYLTSLVEIRKIDANNLQIRIGIFDSDTSTQLVNDSEKKVYSLKIEPKDLSTELLFTDDEIKMTIGERRLFIGDEFNSRTKIHNTDPSLTLGGDNANLNKAGKRVIIESDVYNRERNNVALSKEKFAQGIYYDHIVISSNSWGNFEHIFEQISAFLPVKVEEKVLPAL